MIRQYELVERVKAYDPNADEEALNKAYVYAMKAHGSQLRASGDPYFSHPLEVAGILTDMKLDSASIITALLHDTIEDTPATPEEIKKLFGAEILHLVDGVTKLTRLEGQSRQSERAENFRKLILATSEDIRVLLVKLADRLHNMRTLHYIKSEKKRQDIARETLDIYAPLAERIGIRTFKDELQELVFETLYPEAYTSLKARLSFLEQEDEHLIDRILKELNTFLTEKGVEAEITGRQKTLASIWQKMQVKNISFEQLSDVMAFRIVVEDVSDCYKVLGYIHQAYSAISDRFKDFISTPKSNRYQCLHTTVIGPEQHKIEIQIRTKEMHEIAELGIAAHWVYKQDVKSDRRHYHWMREILEIVEHAKKPEEFLEHTKMELFHDQVFCFTPKGNLIPLPLGATPVDFAYAVHSEIGDCCVGAKVNGVVVPLDTKLKNGDQIKISTSKHQQPLPAWEEFVVTGKAKACIRRLIHSKQKEEYAELGRAMMEKLFREEEYEFSNKAFKGILKHFQFNKVEEIFTSVGSGVLTSREVFNKIFPGHQSKTPITAFGQNAGKPPLAIKGLTPGVAVHFSRCCWPVPGDRIVGIVTEGKGIAIHTIDCHTLEVFLETEDRWLDVSWESNAAEITTHTGRIRVRTSNEMGSLGNLATTVSKNGGNIYNLRILNRTADFWEIFFDIRVSDLVHLNNIMAALRTLPITLSVERERES